MIKFYRISILILSVLFLSFTVSAATWQILPKESKITFKATQNNAPVTGEFKNFSGDINFDPENLAQSNVKITVDVNSISDPYNQLAETLKTSDWFDVKEFPQAVFRSSEISKTGDKNYQAKGTFTIRDKTLPVVISFSQGDEYAPGKARVKGTTIIKRKAFGVGQGEWGDTNVIKDDVEIDFDLALVRTQVKTNS